MFRAYFPLSPRFFASYPAGSVSCAASLGSTFGTYLIGHGPAAARAYSDIFLVQYPDCLRLVILLEPSQELTAADQVPAYGDQSALVLVA